MLSILGLIAVFIATYYIYKTAKDTNRNAVGWALLTFTVGFGFQMIFPVIIGLVLTIVLTISGSSMTEIQIPVQTTTIIASVVGLIFSFIGIWLIMRRVSRIPEDEIFVDPPSPPNFDEKT